MKYLKIFEDWYEFSYDEYRLMEKKLRQLDGKRRLIKVERNGLFEKVLIRKWKVDTDDKVFKMFEESVRKRLAYYLFKDDDMFYYVYKVGVVASAGRLYRWTQANLEKVIDETLKIAKEKMAE